MQGGNTLSTETREGILLWREFPSWPVFAAGDLGQKEGPAPGLVFLEATSLGPLASLRSLLTLWTGISSLRTFNGVPPPLLIEKETESK